MRKVSVTVQYDEEKRDLFYIGILHVAAVSVLPA